MKINTIQIRNPYLDKTIQSVKQSPKQHIEIQQPKQSKKVVNVELNKGSIIDVVI